VAAILTTARFCEPSSELPIEDRWYARTALEDLLGVPVPKVYTDRLYAGLDRLIEHKESLEKHLQERLGDLFDLKYELLLYDVTRTYFEGLCEANPMAQRGYSRDSRPDCLQVCIGLVVTEDGMPLGHEVFDGNTHDSKTLETIVTAMEAKYGRAHRIWVVDRGMVSKANLKFLRGQGVSYIVGTPKTLLRQFEQHLTDQDWQQVQEGVEVKLVHGPDGQEVFVLARSRDRRQKEQAMHQRFRERMEAALQKMRQSAATGHLKDLTLAQRRCGPAGSPLARQIEQRPSRLAGQSGPTPLRHGTGRSPESVAPPLGSDLAAAAPPDRRVRTNVVKTFDEKRPWRYQQCLFTLLTA
jgi:hypothetical protein